MKTVTRTLYLTAFRWPHTPRGEISWAITPSEFKPGEHDALGCWPHKITVPMPEDFNPVSDEVASLEAQEIQALADYHKSVKTINERLSKLLAITNEVTT